MGVGEEVARKPHMGDTSEGLSRTSAETISITCEHVHVGPTSGMVGRRAGTRGKHLTCGPCEGAGTRGSRHSGEARLLCIWDPLWTMQVSLWSRLPPSTEPMSYTRELAACISNRGGERERWRGRSSARGCVARPRHATHSSTYSNKPTTKLDCSSLGEAGDGMKQHRITASKMMLDAPRHMTDKEGRF